MVASRSSTHSYLSRGSEGTIHLPVDPGGDAVLAVAALSGEDGIDDGGEDRGLVRGIGAEMSEGTGADKLGPGVTGFEEVEEPGQEAMGRVGANCRM